MNPTQNEVEWDFILNSLFLGVPGALIAYGITGTFQSFCLGAGIGMVVPLTAIIIGPLIAKVINRC